MKSPHTGVMRILKAFIYSYDGFPGPPLNQKRHSGGTWPFSSLVRHSDAVAGRSAGQGIAGVVAYPDSAHGIGKYGR